MTSVLVTGGSGFVGRHLVSELLVRGRRVRVLDVRPPTHSIPAVEYVEGSVLDPERVDRSLQGIDQVYHLAGLPGMWTARKSDFHTVNFQGTQVVINAARRRGIARFLHCSTESILFHSSPSHDAGAECALLPADKMPGLYTRSKMLAEQLVSQAAASGFPAVIGTPTMPIGLHDHNLTPPTAMIQHFLGGALRLYVDFAVNLVDVRDVATGLVLAMERGQVGHRYVLGGESIQLSEILRIVADTSGRQNLHMAIPGRVAEVSAAVLEFIADHVTRRPPVGTAEGVRIAMRATALSIGKAQTELGYAPRPVEAALRDTLLSLLDTGGIQASSPRKSFAWRLIRKSV
jgi:dihydroflavonol-4-reductase